MMKTEYVEKKKKYSIGDKNHSLQLIKELGYKNGKRLGLFRCDCGKYKAIKINEVLGKRVYHIKSCGCKIYLVETPIKRKQKKYIGHQDGIEICLNCEKVECDNCLA